MKTKIGKVVTKTMWKEISDTVCRLHNQQPKTTSLLVLTDRVLPLSDTFPSKASAERAARLVQHFRGDVRAFAIHTPSAMHLYDDQGRELEWYAMGSTSAQSYKLTVCGPLASAAA